MYGKRILTFTNRPFVVYRLYILECVCRGRCLHGCVLDCNDKLGKEIIQYARLTL